MSDTQIIKGVELPKAQGSYVVYPYGDMRDNGTSHESDRIIVRIRRRKGVVELVAARGLFHVVGKYSVELPTLSSNTVKSTAAAARFAFKLDQALRNCAETLSSAL